MRIEQDVAIAKALLEQFKNTIEGDEQFAHDLIEGETNLIEAIQAIDAQIVYDQAMIDGIDEYIKILGARKERLKTRILKMRASILQAMQDVNIRKINTPTGTLSCRRTQRTLVVIDEKDIPKQFWIPSDPKLDKAAILDELKKDKCIPGATLSDESVSLQISRK